MLTITQTSLNADHTEDMRNKGWNSALSCLENLNTNASNEHNVAQFTLTYVGGRKPATPEEGKAHMAKHIAWMSTLDAVTPQQPLKTQPHLAPKRLYQ